MISTIKQDLYRRYGKIEFSLIERMEINKIPQVKFMNIKRKIDWYRNKNKIKYYYYSFIYRKLKIKYNVDIPARTKIGNGFLIEHIGAITVNPDVIIGNNCSIYNGVTIGVEKRGERKGVPTIGNKVWIGANSIVVGGIIIGDNVLIAPGAFVNFNVPSNSLVIGNPGIIKSKYDATEIYIDNLV
ncbi:MAG: serine acetyltransferase [Clostridiales bacterium]|nr:serine acetyltransferase [Clostridiales bacterium]